MTARAWLCVLGAGNMVAAWIGGSQFNDLIVGAAMVVLYVTRHDQ